jgi:hypothetical protein
LNSGQRVPASPPRPGAASVATRWHLRNEIAGDSIDLVYLDPPFNSQASYNVLLKGPSGKEADAQFEAFEDTWHRGEQAERALSEACSGNRQAIPLRCKSSAAGANDAAV